MVFARKLMDIIRLIIIASLVFAAVCSWRKFKPVAIGKFLAITHFLLLICTIALIILLFHDYRLNGTYSNSIVAILFIVSGILLFGVTTNKLVKWYSTVIFGVNALFQIALLFAPNGLLFFYALGCFLFQPPYMIKDLGAKKHVEFYEPFLGPPTVYVSAERFGILKSGTPMAFKNGGDPSSQINVEQTTADSLIACCIMTGKDSCIKDTLVFR